MSFLPIHLGVLRDMPLGGMPSLLARPIDETSLKASIFRRDSDICRFCGFQAKKYQQICFLNSDNRDWKSSNLVTSCIFCEQCFRMERVGQMRSGAIIWLPEINQVALHHICRAIYIARISPGSMADAANAALQLLLGRREDAKQRIGTDDPATLSSALQDYLEDNDYNQRKKKLDGLRLLPLDRRIIKETDIEFNQFPQILAYWRSKDGPFNGAMPASWAVTFGKLAVLPSEG